MIKSIGRFSLGTGDRFGRQAGAQLAAVAEAKKLGVDIDIVWNKSNREHTTIGTGPEDVREAADAAIAARKWTGRYFVDADHVNLTTVDRFLAASDFFTLDVANAIGREPKASDREGFLAASEAYIDRDIAVPGLAVPLRITGDLAEATAQRYAAATAEAAASFDHIDTKLGVKPYLVEVSMDETAAPQSPAELFLILAALAKADVPVQTVAPRFSGRFNKGVDYVGDLGTFRAEFEAHMLICAFAAHEFALPDNLKLSVHSGSDKFAIYPVIRDLCKTHRLGVHVKTAGTTWLEELIGLAESGGEGLEIAREIYARALERREELAGPYAEVIDIDSKVLPSAEDVDRWSGSEYARTLRHDQGDERYNPSFRQLLHVAYKLAAEMGDRYFDALEANADMVNRQVTENLLERHIKRLFL
jgi:hypothetical protein